MADTIIHKTIHYENSNSINDQITSDSASWSVDSLADTVPTKQYNFTFDSLSSLKHVDPTLNLKINYHNQPVSDWSIILLILILILLASIRAISDNYIGKLLSSTFNRIALSRLYREKVADTIFNIHFRLNLLFHINISYLIYYVVEKYEIFTMLKGLLLYLAILLIIWLLLEIKTTIYRFGGWVFQTKETIDEFLFYAFSSNRTVGIALTPIVIALILLDGYTAQFFLITGISLVIFAYINGLIKATWIIAQKVLSVSYLILYLCTLEILPLLIVIHLSLRA